MKLFPFSLIRLSGLSFPEANDGLLAHVNTILEIERRLDAHRLELIEALLAFKNKSTDYSHKNVIKNLIADIRRNRTVRKKEKYNFSNSILEQFELWQSTKQQLIVAKEVFESQYENAKTAFRQKIKSELSKKPIKSSIALSNYSAYQQIDKYIQSNENSLNKKLRQTELAALKFWSRTATKTSPFAGLGPLAWVNSDKVSNPQYKVNQVLLIYLEEFIINQDWAVEKLQFAINPSLERKDNSFQYLVNVRNSETIKVIEHQALLELLFKEFPGQQHLLTDWVNLLLEYVEVEEKTLSSFMWQLKAEGLLLPVFPSHKENSLWLEKWLTFSSEKFPNHSLLQETLAITHKLEQSETLDWDALYLVHKSWKELIGVAFDLEIERVIYRDDYWKVESTVNLAEENPWIKSITPFLPALSKYAFSKQSVAIEKTFEEIATDRISLLDFYVFFHKAKPIDVRSAIDNFKPTENEMIQRMDRIVFPLKNEIVNIDKKLLAEILGQEKAMENKKWIGSLVQKGEGLPYLRNLFPGHGKMMSRFLQDEAIVAAIRRENTAFDDEIMIDHSDNSAFNANLHPELTKDCLSTLYPISKENPTNKIALQDLEIRKVATQLELWSISKNKRVRPINYGLEGLDRRSPLYQLIQNFGPKVADFTVLKKPLLQILSEEKEWGTFQPRIQLFDQVVIHRKTWVINRSAIPVKEKGQTEANYHLTLLSTFAALKIPLHGFMKRIKVKSDPFVKGQHKPQYFDLREAIYCGLFHQMVQKTTGAISWEEVYPYPSKNHPFPRHAQEWVIEWIA